MFALLHRPPESPLPQHSTSPEVRQVCVSVILVHTHELDHITVPRKLLEHQRIELSFIRYLLARIMQFYMISGRI